MDLTSGRNVLVHQTADFLDRDVVQFPLDPLVRRACQLEPDVSLDAPIAECVLVRFKSNRVSQRGQRTSFHGTPGALVL